jgi:hypothetical protein
MSRGTTLLVAAVLVLAGSASACERQAPSPRTEPTVGPSETSRSSGTGPQPSTPGPTPPPEPDPVPPPGTVPPPWLGTRVLPETATGYGEVRPTPPALRNRRFTLPDTVSPLPGAGFASRVVSPPPAAVVDRSTWRPRCPVDVADLAWVRLSFWGFDGERHTGELLVHEAAADDLVSVFGRLYRARFPLEEVTITTRAEQDAPPTGDGNATTAFDCRPTTGGTSYSQHAYGLAIDVNSFQNPSVKGDLVLPELASSYLDRGRARPGMIQPGGPVVRAFASIGWAWGGDWRTLKDYQHFSLTGR